MEAKLLQDIQHVGKFLSNNESNCELATKLAASMAMQVKALAHVDCAICVQLKEAVMASAYGDEGKVMIINVIEDKMLTGFTDVQLHKMGASNKPVGFQKLHEQLPVFCLEEEIVFFQST